MALRRSARSPSRVAANAPGRTRRSLVATLLLLPVARLAAAASPGGVRPGVVFTIAVRMARARAATLDAQVAAPIEQALRAMPDVHDVRSRSSDGGAIVEARFDGTDPPDAIAARIAETLAALRPSLPSAATKPTIAWSRDRAGPG